MSKIAIVGAGNAGCITALELFYMNIEEQEDVITEIEIFHDPDIPIERVGQGNQLSQKTLLFDSLDLNWQSDNRIGATFKSGIRYENWGKKNHDFFHGFGSGDIACHYIPSKFSSAVLDSGFFKVTEAKITDPEGQIDADFIVDCRGRPEGMDDMYETLSNPLNSAILSRKEGRDPDLHYTRCIATPNGWTFVIPNVDSVSYGYLYNDSITPYAEATEDFMSRFGVIPDGSLKFDNYVAKNIWSGERTILNGNRYSFIEPMEATSTSVHQTIATLLYDHIDDKCFREEVNTSAYEFVKQNENFIKWHYETGSKFDSPFWDYATQFIHENDPKFEYNLTEARTKSRFEENDEDGDEDYGAWGPFSFRNWWVNTDLNA